MKFIIPGFLFFLFIANSLDAQLREVEHNEIMITDGNTSFRVEPVGKWGVLLYRETKNLYSTTERTWEVVLFDKDLQSKWRRAFSTNISYSVVASVYSGDICYFLFLGLESSKKPPIVLKLNLIDFSSETFEIDQYVPLRLDYFNAIGSSLLFTGIHKGKQSAFCYQFGDIRPKVLESIFEKNSRILDVVSSAESGIFRIYLAYKMPGRKKSLMIKDYDPEGNLIRQLLLQPGRGNTILDGEMISFQGEESFDVVLGSYSSRLSNMADGIFTARINSVGDQEFKYYKFANLKNFYRAMYEHNSDDGNQEIGSENESEGRKNLNMNISIRPPIYKGGSPFCIGECFTRSDFYLEAFYNFEMGYDFKHGVIIGLNSAGDIQWDNAMSLLNVPRRTNGNQKVYVEALPEANIMFYTAADHIYYQLFEGTEQMSPVESIRLSRRFQDEQGKEPDINSVLLPWFENKYLLYGNWVFEDLDDPVKIFFMKKIEAGT